MRSWRHTTAHSFRSRRSRSLRKNMPRNPLFIRPLLPPPLPLFPLIPCDGWRTCVCVVSCNFQTPTRRCTPIEIVCWTRQDGAVGRTVGIQRVVLGVVRPWRQAVMVGGEEEWSGGGIEVPTRHFFFPRRCPPFFLSDRPPPHHRTRGRSQRPHLPARPRRFGRR